MGLTTRQSSDQFGADQAASEPLRRATGRATTCGRQRGGCPPPQPDGGTGQRSALYRAGNGSGGGKRLGRGQRQRRSGQQRGAKSA